MKCVMPFGVVVAGEAEYPSSYLIFAANVIGEFLDPSSDGTLDLQVAAALAGDGSEQPFLAGFRAQPSDEACNDGCFDLMSRNAIDGARDARRILVEEVHHLLLQRGWSQAYPDIFGVETWESTIAQAKRKAECVWFHHPENFSRKPMASCEKACPGSCDRVCDGGSCFQCSWRLGQMRDDVYHACLRACPDGICQVGGCAEPECDVVEFFFRAHMAFIGDAETFFLEPMAHQLASGAHISEHLTSGMVDALTSPRFQLRRTPVTGVYSASRQSEL